MRKLYEGITAKPIFVIVLFCLMTLVGAVLQSGVAVNYDINSYLPSASHSTISIDVLQEEYEGGIPNARAMISDVTIAEALEYKEKIQAIKGVTGVTWLDDSYDCTQPTETMDTRVVETYYKDGNALFSITIEDAAVLDAVAEIRELIGDENAMEGSAVSTAASTNSTVSEVQVITILAILFVLAVLILTTKSWVEPIIILAGIGIAIMINNGTNLFFGEISFVSNAAGPILQLAVSLDYFVFLLHRFEACRKEISDPHSAMVEALTKSTSSILSSGLTTVIGFVALCLMRFRIGPDLGIVLAKGVAISLICVFVLMPNLILVTYKLMDKTHHKAFLPQFDGFAKFVTKIMIPVACVFIVAIAPSYLASNANSYYYGASYVFNEKTQVGKDTKAIEDIFGKSDTYVLMVPKGNRVTQQELSYELKKFPQVISVLSYVDTVGIEVPEEYLEPDTLEQLNSEKYTRMVLTLDTDYEGEEAFQLVQDIRATAEEYYNNYYLAGNSVSTYDLMNTVTSDMTKVNLIAILAVFLVLLITMKSVTLPLILVISIETAIWINLSVPYFAETPIFYIAYLIISSIQLGATVDYAILFTDTYLEHRQTMPKKQTIQKVISTCIVSVLTSSSVLTVVGFLMGGICSHGLLSQLGVFLGRGTLCSLVIVLFALPGLLWLFDGLIHKTTRNANFYKGE